MRSNLFSHPFSQLYLRCIVPNGGRQSKINYPQWRFGRLIKIEAEEENKKNGGRKVEKKAIDMLMKFHKLILLVTRL